MHLIQLAESEISLAKDWIETGPDELARPQVRRLVMLVESLVKEVTRYQHKDYMLDGWSEK